MSASEASILARLEQMKKWQEQHYSRLMSQHQQNLEQASLPPSNKDGKNETKAKRPFLRKGAGLARYRLTAGQQRRPYRGGTLPQFRSSRKQVKFIDSGVTDSGATVLTPLKKPDVTIQTTKGCTWTDVLSHQIDSDVATSESCESSCDEEVLAVDASCDVYEREPSLIPVLLEDFQDSGGEDETLVNENTSQADLIVFEELERRAAHSSFCSTNSSVVRLLATSSPRKAYNSDKQLDTVEAEQLQRELEFAALQAETEKLRRIYNSDLFISSTTDQETCLTCCAKPATVCDMATMTDIPEPRLSHEAMEEIESERRLCRKEQIRVERLRAQLEEEQREFRKEKKEMLRHVELEKESTREKAEEERRKLAKERMVFERYVKELQSKPSKKDREELSALKTELCNLRELLKVKDTKNGMTQARLRNTIKSLEKETDRLKVETENLQRQNARLLALQAQNQRKKSPSDTKMLHEINKNLTKLTRDMKVSSRADEEVVRVVEVDESEVKEQENCARRKRESAEREKESVVRERKSLVRQKENDINVANNSDDIERSYEKMFGNLSSESQQKDRVEEVLDDGTKVIKYPNGNIKKRSPDGNRTVLNFYNGDVKETDLLKGTTRYFYCETKLWHTVNLDGTEVFEYPSGNIEKKYPDGTSSTTDTTGVVNHKYPDGREKTVYVDGTVVMLDPTGEKVLTLPNGQKEIHNEMHKRREYPDGTVKILYPDGLQETRYSNGRMRIRDKNGKLIMDSFDNDS